MTKPVLTLQQVMVDAEVFRIPRIVAYNRLEGRPRTTDFTESLASAVRDPLWMLTRQWQFGEFRGEDAASPLVARIAYRHFRPDHLALGDHPGAPFDPSELPMEARVEREPVPFVVRETTDGDEYSDMLLAVRWGTALRRHMTAAGLDGHYHHYLNRFPLRPSPPADEYDRRDTEAAAVAAAVVGRTADGVAVWRAARSGEHDAWLSGQVGADEGALVTLVSDFAQACSNSVERIYTQPVANDDSAWLPNHLEYQFAVGAAPNAVPATPVLRAQQYHQGHLDWHSFDAVSGQTLAAEAAGQGEPGDLSPDLDPETVESFLPAPVRFKGQPQQRFWQMEESQTDFGKIDTSPTGLLHLLLAEFGLIYGNDWFMLPHPMRINTVCEIRGLLVDDNFGRHTFIRAAGRAPESAWQRFALFHLNEVGLRAGAAGNLFYLAPAVGKLLESEPIERINLVRDEMANLAWAIEAVVPSQTGQGMSGYRAAGPRHTDPPWTAPADDVRIGYVAGTTVPKNWIPFVPVHIEGSVSEIRLQRGRMAGGAPPRGRLLREPGSPYFVEEEEVPRAGVYVERSWQRTRWLNGQTVIWVGRRKSAGRGEGASSLAFDRVVDLPPPAGAEDGPP